MIRASLLMMLLSFFSCQVKRQEEANVTKYSETVQVPSYMPNTVDSVDLLYFRKPFTDSLRYQRFFTFIRSGDSSLISALRDNLELGFQEYVNPIDCLSEGKIIVPHGGDAFRIIYFSRTQIPCSYIYVIDNGRFRYYPLTENVKKALDEWEGLAVEP
jgi:hypothetical protein